MHAAECHFHAVDFFTVGAFVDLAAAMSADVKAWSDGYGDEFRKTFEKSPAEFSAFFGEFEDFFYFVSDWFESMFD